MNILIIMPLGYYYNIFLYFDNIFGIQDNRITKVSGIILIIIIILWLCVALKYSEEKKTSLYNFLKISFI